MGNGLTGYLRRGNDTSRVHLYARDLFAGVTESTSDASVAGNFESLSNCSRRRESNYIRGAGKACPVQTMGATIP